MTGTTNPPPPPFDFNAGGWARVGRLRARPSWFFGLVIIEELMECFDGRVEWRRIKYPTSLTEGRKR